MSALTTIREATPEDVPALVAMGVTFLRESNYRLFVRENPDQIANLAHQLIERPEGVVLVAVREETPVGMIGLVAYPHFMSGDPVVGEVIFFVEPHARGVGVRLLHAAEAWAVSKGATAMQMISPAPRVDLLYQRLGYQPVERTFQRALGVH